MSLLLLVLAAGPVKERPLYIRARDTAVLKDAKASSTTLTRLQPGTQVTWKGAAPNDHAFHRIAITTPKPLEGFVLQPNLSPNPVAVEVMKSDGVPLSTQAFVGSGAATKAVSEGGKMYATQKSRQDVVPKLEAVEAIARSFDPAPPGPAAPAKKRTAK